MEATQKTQYLKMIRESWGTEELCSRFSTYYELIIGCFQNLFRQDPALIDVSRGLLWSNRLRTPFLDLQRFLPSKMDLLMHEHNDRSKISSKEWITETHDQFRIWWHLHMPLNETWLAKWSRLIYLGDIKWMTDTMVEYFFYPFVSPSFQTLYMASLINMHTL